MSVRPTDAHGIWYHQPWTFTASGLLLIYSLLSFGALWLLFITRRLDRKLNWIPSDDPRRERLRLLDLWRISTSEPDAELTPTGAQLQMARERAQQRQSIVSIVETEINDDDEIDDQSRDRRSQQWTLTAEGDIEMRTMQRQGYAFLNSPDYQQARMMQIMIEHEIYDEAQFNAEMRNRQLRGERWSQDFY
ncbi:hypothetical protein KC352_g40712 [Hortaea werneckii]|nr:hypothetical protein KC352_g40712 [Hortaea werneckii]